MNEVSELSNCKYSKFYSHYHPLNFLSEPILTWYCSNQDCKNFKKCTIRHDEDMGYDGTSICDDCECYIQEEIDK